MKKNGNGEVLREFYKSALDSRGGNGTLHTSPANLRDRSVQHAGETLNFRGLFAVCLATIRFLRFVLASGIQTLAHNSQRTARSITVYL